MSDVWLLLILAGLTGIGILLPVLAQAWGEQNKTKERDEE